MIEIKRQVKEGFENEFESLMAKKSTLSVEKEEAIQKAIEEVNQRYSEREGLIENLLTMISDEVQVEVPDPEVESEELVESDSEEEVQESEASEESAEAGMAYESPEMEYQPEPEQQTPVAGERLDPSQIRI